MTYIHTYIQKLCHAEFIPASIQLANTDKILKQVQDDVRAYNFGKDAGGGRFFSPFPFHISPRFAFTLAEVLITLGIIGVVAAITIPILNNAVLDAQYKTAYKKAYSDASNAWRTMAANDEIIPCPDLAAVTGNICTYPNFDTFKTYIKISTDCGTASVKSCWDITGESINDVLQNGVEVAPDKPAATNSRGFIDASGRSWIMTRGSFIWRVILAVDTNGFAPPNRFGKDRNVFFAVNEKGLGGVYSAPYPGTPINLAPAVDFASVKYYCGYPPCYGTSWLLN